METAAGEGVPFGTRAYPSALGGPEVDKFGNKGNERAVKRIKRQYGKATARLKETAAGEGVSLRH